MLSSHPTDAAALHLLGLSLEQQKKYDEGVDCLCRSLEIDPTVPDYHNNLGTILGRCGHPAEAAACFREALRLRPDFPAARKNLGESQRKKGPGVL